MIIIIIIAPLVAESLHIGQFWVRSTASVHDTTCGNRGHSAPSSSTK